MGAPKDPEAYRKYIEKKSISMKGKNTEPKSEETKRKISNTLIGKYVGKNSPRYSGGEVTVICQQCGKEFKVKKYRQETAKFCSRNCLGKSKVGNKNPFYGKHHKK